MYYGIDLQTKGFVVKSFLLRKFIREAIRASTKRLAVLRVNPFIAVLYDVNEFLKWAEFMITF